MFELRGIRAGYGDVVVLRDVSVSLPPGAVVALLGPNGAGKTTLVRVASGLMRPLGGEIVIDGERMTGRRAHEFVQRGVCHIPEGRGIFRGMTVRENLVLQTPGHRADEAVDQAVELFPVLGRRLNQVAGTLSGGEQQMVAVVRAYLANPRFVFLDEVSLGLAPKIVDEIFEFLGVLAAGGAALLLVEQYVLRALDLADFVYILNRGQLTFAGESGELDEDDVFRSYVGAAL